MQNSLEDVEESLPANGSATSTLLFNQAVDHFNPSDKRTFKQRYFVDASYAQNKNSPVIYVMCGEGTCSGAASFALVNSFAKSMKAYRVALEHRYYGESQPFSTLASPNLKYLSTDQAIEDLATFQKFLQGTEGLTGKWISVGGSYSGALSAFYRLKHPELVNGALASSAPVLAKANFEEYDHHVAKVAGPQCLEAIQETVLDVEAKLKNSASATQVKALFNASTIRDHVDFLYVLADMAAIAIQYGFQSQFCSAIVAGMQAGKVTEAYAKVGTQLLTKFGITALQDSFQGAESLDPKDYLSFAGMRSWMYQSCTEFGYYQTAYHIPLESSRSSQVTLQFHHDVCKRLFGIAQPVNENTSNQKYYLPLFSRGVKNIYFTNGSNDPWSNLSIQSNTPGSTENPGLKLFTISGSAHCDDLGTRVSTALSTARSQFETLARQWLYE